MIIPWIQSINYLINQWWVGFCFYRKSSIHFTPSVSQWVQVHRAGGWSSIRNHHYHSWSPAAITATEHVCLPTPRVPQGHLHPPLLSTTELWLLWQPCCHGSIYFGADLDRGWLHIQPSASDQLCHTYTLAWSAAGSWVSADLGQEWDCASNGWSSGSGDAWDETTRVLWPTILRRCKNSPPAANFLTTSRDWESLRCSWKWLSNNGDACPHRTTGSPIQP